MLIEFRVKNYRSIKNEQVFSMVASKDKSLRKHNVFETDSRAIPGVIRSAAIFGPNASGKSNLLTALGFMKACVLYSTNKRKEGEELNFKPFLLDQETAKEPSSFEVTFLIDGIRYQYGFSLTQDRIISEHLFVYKNFKPQQWFKRWINSETNEDIYEFKTGLSGSKQIWENTTRPDALFLSTATQLNSKDLKPIYDWFARKLLIIGPHTNLLPVYTADMIENNSNKRSILSILQSADLNIDNVHVEKKNLPGPTVKIDQTEIGPIETGIKVPIINFSHRGKQENVFFDFAEESDGTRALFRLAGPTLSTLEEGDILIIDELDSSLHPLLVKAYIKLFHDKESNTGNAQLIFSTHNAFLLDTAGLFRRDQIYFTEKGNDQATELVSLSEFSPRQLEDIQKQYLSGRYGAIPLIDEQLRL